MIRSASNISYFLLIVSLIVLSGHSAGFSGIMLSVFSDRMAGFCAASSAPTLKLDELVGVLALNLVKSGL